ncbi:hypothetical protein [Paraburkholderia sediminicola]|uniref:hypothetical protein n=1 Tax=Paraburkholderia sediminicola TaxID=458836 RepID=UPI0038BC4B57
MQRSNHHRGLGTIEVASSDHRPKIFQCGPVGREIHLIAFKHPPVGIVGDVIALLHRDMLIDDFIKGVDLLIDRGSAGIVGTQEIIEIEPRIGAKPGC